MWRRLRVSGRPIVPVVGCGRHRRGLEWWEAACARVAVAHRFNAYRRALRHWANCGIPSHYPPRVATRSEPRWLRLFGVSAVGVLVLVAFVGCASFDNHACGEFNTLRVHGGVYYCEHTRFGNPVPVAAPRLWWR